MESEWETLRREAQAALEELLEAAGMQAGRLVVVGCSTSEVRGAKIGSAGSDDVARAVLAGLKEACHRYGVFLAVQCCEHLNRALVVERAAMEQYNLEQVAVVPVPKAGGALGARAMHEFDDAVVVESIQAHAGLDIGSTLIGMHLKRVAVPVRLNNNRVGQASVTAAKTRPKLIGGARAVYELPK